jgi:hypothetical protein
MQLSMFSLTAQNNTREYSGIRGILVIAHLTCVIEVEIVALNRYFPDFLNFAQRAR